MDKSTRDAELKLLAEIWSLARKPLEDEFGKNSCIPTTKVVVECLQRLGIKAHPLTVSVQILNHEYLETCELLGRGPRNRAEAIEWQKERGIFSYGFGHIEAEGYWKGHLIAVVSRTWIADLTIEQANHPQYGVNLEPIFGGVSGRFLNGVESAKFNVNGSRVIYISRPTDRTYTLTPNWSSTRCREIVERTIELLTP